MDQHSSNNQSGRYLELNGDIVGASPLQRAWKSPNATTDALLITGLVAVAPDLTTAFSAASAVVLSHFVTDPFAKKLEKTFLISAGLSKKNLVIDTTPDHANATDPVNMASAKTVLRKTSKITKELSFGSLVSTIPTLMLCSKASAFDTDSLVIPSLVIGVSAYVSSLDLALTARTARLMRNFNNVTKGQWAIVERPKPKKAKEKSKELSPYFRSLLESLRRKTPKPVPSPARIETSPAL